MTKKSTLAELKNALGSHTANMERISNDFTNRITTNSEPEIIYHYTDDKGLKGILETGKLWFTDMLNLNDPSELDHGITQALNILNRETKTTSQITKVLRSVLTKILTGNLSISTNWLVCCFSKTNDDLGQWRAYADDGRGYAIGFETKSLKKAFAESQNHIPHSMFSVSYDDSEICALHEKLVRETISFIEQLEENQIHEKDIVDFITEVAISFITSCVTVSLYFKHEAYRNEQEYRLLQLNPADAVLPDLKFRTRPYSLVKYREFDWKSSAKQSLKSIICGPANESARANKFAQDCLREYVPDHKAEVTQSLIPYRSVRY